MGSNVMAQLSTVHPLKASEENVSKRFNVESFMYDWKILVAYAIHMIVLPEYNFVFMF